MTRWSYQETSDCAFSQYASVGACPVADGGASPADGGVVADGGVAPADGGTSVSPDAGVTLDGGVIMPDGGVVADGGTSVPLDGGTVVLDGGVIADGGTSVLPVLEDSSRAVVRLTVDQTRIPTACTTPKLVAWPATLIGGQLSFTTEKLSTAGLTLDIQVVNGWEFGPLRAAIRCGTSGAELLWSAILDGGVLTPASVGVTEVKLYERGLLSMPTDMLALDKVGFCGTKLQIAISKNEGKTNCPATVP